MVTVTFSNSTWGWVPTLCDWKMWCWQKALFFLILCVLLASANFTYTRKPYSGLSPAQKNWVTIQTVLQRASEWWNHARKVLAPCLGTAGQRGLSQTFHTTVSCLRRGFSFHLSLMPFEVQASVCLMPETRETTMNSFYIKQIQVWKGSHISKQVNPAMIGAFAKLKMVIQHCC